MLSLSLGPPLLESSSTSPPPSPPLPVTPTMEDNPPACSPSSSSSTHYPTDLPLPPSTSRNNIFSSQWGFSPEGKLAPPRALPLALKLEALDDGGGAAERTGSWSSSNSRRASSSSSSIPMGSPNEFGATGGSSCSTSPNNTTHGSNAFPGLVAVGESASTFLQRPSFPSSSSFSKPSPPPNTPYRGGHQKNPSTSSSVSSKTSSFFDTPTPSATPPPPDSSSTSTHPPPHVFHQLEHLIPSSSPTRNSHFASLQQLKPSSPKLCPSSSSNASSPLSPIPKHALPQAQQQPSSSFNASTSAPPPPPPPPPHSLRLNPSEPYLLGRGLRASVYLSSILPSSSKKGKERERTEWTLAATKIPLADDGIEGRESLVREAKVLTWLGGKRAGIVGFFGLVDLGKAKVKVVKQQRKEGGRGSFETYTFDPSSSLGELGGTIPTRPVLLLEYCAFGTIDTFVKTHPELVNEEVWTRWVGVLGSAGEWLEERGVVHRDIKPQNILLTSSLLPLLTDFGSSLLPLSSSTTSSAIVPAFQTTGTTPYASPEMLLHPETVSFPSDVFSLGASLYVALSGTEPFKGVSGNREMVFWVGKGGFWEWEERRRGASWGEGGLGGMGGGGVKRGGSLREANHTHTHQPHTSTNNGNAVSSGLPSSTSLGTNVANHNLVVAAAAELRRVGSWEVLKPRAAGGGSGSVADGWWRSGAEGGEYTSPNPSLRLRTALEGSLLVPGDDDDEEEEDGGDVRSSPSPKGRSKPLLEPLSLSKGGGGRTNQHPPPPRLEFPPNPPLSLPSTSSSHPCVFSSPLPSSSLQHDDEEEPLEGLPMFFPSSTRENPQQVSDSARRLLKKMLDPDPRRRETMRGVREWAQRRGWKAQ